MLTPIKAIREKCVDCCGGQRLEVKYCTVTKCHLSPYRMGHRPKGNKDIAESNKDRESDVNLTEVDLRIDSMKGDDGNEYYSTSET